MTKNNNFANTKSAADREIEQLKWRLEQTENARDYWHDKYNKAKIDFSFTEELDYKLTKYKQIAATLALELEYYKELLQTIYNAFPRKINESDPCPVCWTYSHKGWCWYEQAKAALEGGEGK